MTEDLAAIRPDVRVVEMLTSHPEAARVFVAHGMQCIGCAFAPHETIAEVCRIYELDLDAFVGELRRSYRDTAERLTPEDTERL